jgi:hypothetical protein
MVVIMTVGCIEARSVYSSTIRNHDATRSTSTSREAVVLHVKYSTLFVHWLYIMLL